MKTKSSLRNVTPEQMQCVVGVTCPSIYELTPREMSCGAMLGCSAIYGDEKSYLIIGEKVKPEEFGLEKKVGKDEVLIKVSKYLIDDKGK